MAIAANKCDLYESEEVNKSEGESLAKELGAIFHFTSAKSRAGLIELFEEIGKKFLGGGKNEKIVNEQKVLKLEKIEEKTKAKKKKKCC